VFPEVHVVAPQKSESRIVLAFPEPERLQMEDLATRAATLRKHWKLRFDLALLVRRGHTGPGELPPGGSVLVDPRP
jgi:hypothetical protein